MVASRNGALREGRLSLAWAMIKLYKYFADQRRSSPIALNFKRAAVRVRAGAFAERRWPQLADSFSCVE